MRVTNRNRRIRGNVVLDSMLGTLVLGIGAVSFFSVYPMLHQSQLHAQEQSKAVQMATRLVEHIQLLPPQNLEANVLSDLNLIDEGQRSSLPPYSFSRIPLDQASLYSPAQALSQGQGTMTIENLPTGSRRVTVEVRWKTNGGWGSVKTGTIVGGYR